MILEIKQIHSGRVNEFEVYENKNVIYKAKTGFYKPVSPIGGDELRRLLLTDADGKTIFCTHYDVKENIKASAIPLSYLFGESKKVRMYNILDAADSRLGAFYYEQDDTADTKMVIEFGGKNIFCFKREVGKKEVVSFYDGEVQIGQLTKPNCVVDNLDLYLLHFLDSFESLKSVAAFFVIYYDFIYHNNSGEIVKGWRANTTYTFDKNSKKYNKKFIAEKFGKDENDRVEAFIKDIYASRKKKKK